MSRKETTQYFFGDRESGRRSLGSNSEAQRAGDFPAAKAVEEDAAAVISSLNEVVTLWNDDSMPGIKAAHIAIIAWIIR